MHRRGEVADGKKNEAGYGATAPPNRFEWWNGSLLIRLYPFGSRERFPSGGFCAGLGGSISPVLNAGDGDGLIVEPRRSLKGFRLW
jgi:hypothetical protein